MTKRMLIDASRPEETRVAVISNQGLEEFDYETSQKAQIKGNIYLAKVIRIEPSLQACFVDYGANRHGFLAFAEIHPDYFKIPVEDRQRLIEEEQQLNRAEQEKQEADLAKAPEADSTPEGEPSDAPSEEKSETADDTTTMNADVAPPAELSEAPSTEAAPNTSEAPVGEEVEIPDEPRKRNPRSNLRRKYRVQEVIKKGQIMLVQVEKEERGNKCAALTSYLSVPGRYCVLMPNSANAGGISRKINSGEERRQLKEVLDKLEIPKNASIIVRTAGRGRGPEEITRDYDYLIRLWDEIREKTLESVAPALIYKEGDVIQQSIRDLYDNDIQEIVVEGAEGYKTARTLMKNLMPEHQDRIKEYNDTKTPLFIRYRVEDSLDEVFSSAVRLRSGGYIVIHPTEALVSIDVNSGRATKQRSIEDTALRTNMEAAEEIARQLRLRDLAGLIVVDFIDMIDRRNIRRVENKLREELRTDRARVQVGRLSQFGLMELSRQRLKRSTFEAVSEPCPTCQGSGVIRSSEFSAMRIFRGIEEQAAKGSCVQVMVTTAASIATYILNEKRQTLTMLEDKYHLKIIIAADQSVIAPNYRIEAFEKLDSTDSNDRDNTQQQQQRHHQPHDRHGRDRHRHDRNNNRHRHDNRHQKHESPAAEPKEASAEVTMAEPTVKPEAEGNDEKHSRNHRRRQGRHKSKSKHDEKESSPEISIKQETVHEEKPAKKSSEKAPAPLPENVSMIEDGAKSPKKGWWNKLVT